MHVKVGAIMDFSKMLKRSLEIYFKAIVATSGLKINNKIEIFAQL